MDVFLNNLKQRFEVEKIVADRPFLFNGFEIARPTNVNIILSMSKYIE